MSRSLVLGCGMAIMASFPAAAIEVVVSVKPLHSLVSTVMQGSGHVPSLLVEGANSPHGFALRPSHVEALSRADIVFWIGDTYETFLDETLAIVAPGGTEVRLIDAPGLTTRPFREGGLFESHEDEGEGEDSDDHGDHNDHGEGSDPHVWLDPANAALMTQTIAENLSILDPENASLYRANADSTIEQIEALELELSSQLQDADGSFFVFHDAYHYFEEAFGLEATGAFTINPAIAPGVQRIDEIKSTIESQEATCIFAEPQFSPRLLETLAADTGARIGVLDPLGADLVDGPDLYFEMMSDLAASFKTCLG